MLYYLFFKVYLVTFAHNFQDEMKQIKKRAVDSDFVSYVNHFVFTFDIELDLRKKC